MATTGECTTHLYEPMFALYCTDPTTPRAPCRTLRMVRTWAIFLVMCAFIMRVSEATAFCPTFDHVRLPTDPRDWNESGLPNKIDIGLVMWKGHTNKSVYWMTLHCNPIHPKRFSMPGGGKSFRDTSRGTLRMVGWTGTPISVSSGRTSFISFGASSL